MRLLDRSSRPHLALTLLLAACTPGSLKLGDDVDSETETATTTNNTDTASESSGEPTTGEPVSEGVLEWTRKFDDIGGFDMAIAGDGSIVVLGMSGYSPAGDGGEFANNWVGKFDPAGALLWAVEQPLEAESSRSPVAVAVGPDGVIHALIIDYGALAGDGNEVRRFGPDGDELGVSTLPARPASIAATADGVLVGGSQSTGDNSSVAWVAALDGAGEQVWARTFGDPGMRWGQVTAIAVDGDEAILGGALGVLPTSSQSKAWLLRLEIADGATVWDNTLTEAVATDVVLDLGLADDGTILALGRESDTVLWAVSPAGEILWKQPAIDPRGGSVAVGKDGSFAFTGGLILPIDDPNACIAGDGACPVAMQIARHNADRSPRWAATREECRVGVTAVVTANDGILVLAGCSDSGLGDAAMGLMQFAP